jgi:fructose-1,6-bisphosphatase/inositol monophosphatase family enzyme
MQNINPDQIATIIKDVAADKIIPRFRQLNEGDIRTKSSPNDLVTIADEEAEIELARILTGLLPGSIALGEEAVSKDHVRRDLLSTHDSPIWVIDPVDGTSNFAHGNPVFGTMLCLVHRGEWIMSWIYQIPTDRMVACEKGAGITFNEEPYIRPAPMAEQGVLNGLSAFVSKKFIPPSIRPYVESKIGILGDAKTYMCCAWEYVQVLEGKAAFSLYKRIEPWDHLAGALLLEEAGFYTRKWDGAPYNASDLTGGLINAQSETMWRAVYETFLEEPIKNLAQPIF